MRFPRNTIGWVAIFAAIGLTSCGNSCFVGIFNNGNGVVVVKAGNPPPACSHSQATGVMSAVALKSPVCETCSTSLRVDHAFVTLRGIQLRPSAVEDTDTADWLEIAPQLANEPRQIDVIGNSTPEILLENAIVPVGSYREVHLEFLPDSAARSEKLPAENACGETRWNCIVEADGHVAPLRFPGDGSELLIAIQSYESDFVLPDSRIDLRLSLEPFQVAYSSSSEGWKLQSVLIGRASVVRRGSVEQEHASSN